ncbi:MAG: hypothetical protein WC614_07575 [bacterium]
MKQKIGSIITTVAEQLNKKARLSTKKQVSQDKNEIIVYFGESKGLLFKGNKKYWAKNTIFWILICRRRGI